MLQPSRSGCRVWEAPGGWRMRGRLRKVDATSLSRTTLAGYSIDVGSRNCDRGMLPAHSAPAIVTPGVSDWRFGAEPQNADTGSAPEESAVPTLRAPRSDRLGCGCNRVLPLSPVFRLRPDAGRQA